MRDYIRQREPFYVFVATMIGFVLACAVGVFNINSAAEANTHTDDVVTCDIDLTDEYVFDSALGTNTDDITAYDESELCSVTDDITTYDESELCSVPEAVYEVYDANSDTAYNEGDVLAQSEIADVIREKLIARSDTFDISYIADTSDISPYAFEDEIFEHTGVGYAGDYLKFHTSFGYNRTYQLLDDGTWLNTCTIDPHYYGFDTAEEARVAEDAVEVRANEILNSLHITELGEYERIKAIYNWVINNISYDYENQSTKLAATAYAGLVNGKCICSGFSTIIYRLMLDAGIDCRYLTGYAGDSWHAWNIVRVGNRYYNLDATWDSSRIGYGDGEFFLVSDADCYDHARDPEYADDVWYAAYPMAETSYIPVYERYRDVDINWYSDAIQWAADNNIMSGYGGDAWGVGDTITRADFVTVLWRYLEPEAYAHYDESSAVNTTGLFDVAGGTYYTGAANWAVEVGIVTGYQLADGSYEFAPSDPVSFDQLVTILARYCIGADAVSTYDSSILFNNKFRDGATVEEWACGAMAWAINSGVVTGNNNGDGTYTIEPLESVARERAVTVLYRCVTEKMI